MVRWSLRRIRLVRAIGAAGAVVLGVLLFTTTWREVGVRTAGGWFVCVGSGCVQAGHNPPRFQSIPAERRGGVYRTDSWHSDWTYAWRPFHVNTGRDNFVVAPLWQWAIVSAGVAVWATGFLSGVRRARSGACLCCGYDLSLVPEKDGVRRCPECGTTPMDVRS